MRKNTKTVLDKFNTDTAFHFSNRPSIWTNGDQIYSYQTCIVERVADDCVIVNMTKYSQTTTIHQNALLGWFTRQGYKVVVLTDLPFRVHDLAIWVYDD